MSDEQERPSPDPEKPDEAQTPAPRPEPAPASGETVSLLDLMAELSGEETAVSEPEADEDNTLTEDMPPAVPKPEQPPAPLPLSAEELTPKRPPLERDPEATDVQPRVAFPGGEEDRPVSEKRTRIYHPQKRPSPPASEQTRPGDETVRQPPIQRERPARPPVRQPPQPVPVRVAIPARRSRKQSKPKPIHRRNWRSCLTRAFIIGFLAALTGAALLTAAAAIGYRSIARDLPEPTELLANVSTFETARLYDRNGREIFSLADPNTGNRTRVPLDQISTLLVQATIATEDSRFYENPGFDPVGIARAIWQAAQEREFTSGASTITQQLVRAVLLDEQERTERTFRRKVREIILAAELSRTYEKNLILELYLNEIYYGNLAYGIEAAAQTYFNKSAGELNLAEASLLAGLPQAPALWDPYSAPDKARGRQWEVLSLMVADGYISLEDARRALDETNQFIYQMAPTIRRVKHPHFIFAVLQEAEDALGGQSIYRGGLRIFTTLDPEAQELAEQVIAEQRGSFNNAGANNAALIALKPGSGEILALVGSADFNDETIDGQVNMALAPRQPGSSIKPLVYLSALEQGWTPATLIWDVPTEFPDGVNPPYRPKNYDDEFHGPLRLRPSLGNSYNIPAVKALEFVGVCNFAANMQKLGLASLQDDGCLEQGQPRNFGLALALGGGEITPLEMAGAYNTLASNGRFLPPFAITRIEDSMGNVQFEHTPPDPAASQVVRPEHAFLLSNILSDNNARQPEFGLNNSLVIPGHRVAAKTGTSGTDRFDVRDGWTIGFTPQIVTAVWVGNTGNEPLGEGQSGYRVATPIWHNFMTQYLADKPPSEFLRPDGITDIEICADSGTRPGIDCPGRLVESFAEDQSPLDSSQDFFQKIPVDLWTNQRADEFCPESIYEATFFTLLASGREEVLNRERTSARAWLETSVAGQRWAALHNIATPLLLPPSQVCNESTERPEVVISAPASGSELIDSVEIRGTVKGPNFTGFVVEYGISHDPEGWGSIQPLEANSIENDVLATWDTLLAEYSGPATIRVIIYGPDNRYTEEFDPVTLEQRVQLTLLEPTPTPTPTATSTPTPTNTPTATPTTTATPTRFAELGTRRVTIPAPPPTSTSTPESSTPTPTPTETTTP